MSGMPEMLILRDEMRGASERGGQDGEEDTRS